MSVLLRVVRNIRGKVFLIAPYWEAQPWFGVPLASPPRVSLPSQQGSRTTPGVTQTSRLEFVLATLSGSYSEQAFDSMLSVHRLLSMRQYQSCWRRFQYFLGLRDMPKVIADLSS